MYCVPSQPSVIPICFAINVPNSFLELILWHFCRKLFIEKNPINLSRILPTYLCTRRFLYYAAIIGLLNVDHSLSRSQLLGSNIPISPWYRFTCLILGYWLYLFHDFAPSQEREILIISVSSVSHIYSFTYSSPLWKLSSYPHCLWACLPWENYANWHCHFLKAVIQRSQGSIG